MAAEAITAHVDPSLRFDHASLRRGVEVPAATPAPTGADSAEAFSQSLIGAVMRANDMSLESARRQHDLAAGLSDDIHGTMIASQEAQISVRLVGSIRNKLLDAFHELWRTSV